MLVVLTGPCRNTSHASSVLLLASPSAVSVDVEGFMYRRCRELNITLFTVSHRKSLWCVAPTGVAPTACVRVPCLLLVKSGT